MNIKLFSNLIIYFIIMILFAPCLSSIYIINVDDIILKKLDVIHVYPGESIQDAINEANPGDIVYVHSGTYYENITIHKSITLKGENKDTTVIDGNHLRDVIVTTVNDVNIQNFTIQNSGQTGWDHGITCGDNIYNVNISSCILKYNSGGIRFNSVNDSTISDCNIYQNSAASITVYDNSDNIHIQNCTIKNNGEDKGYSGYIGIFGDDMCSNITVSGCQISNNYNGGISIKNAENIYISNNNLYGNTRRNIFIIGSTNIHFSNVNIYNNEILNGPNAGIQIQDCQGGIKVEKNNIDNNDASGIYLLRSQNINIRNNTITESKAGINLDDSPDSIITGNTISNNKAGIKLQNCLYDIKTLREKNTFSDNDDDVVLKKRNWILSILLNNFMISIKLMESLNRCTRFLLRVLFL